MIFLRFTYARLHFQVKRYLSTKGLMHKAILLIDNAASHASEEQLKSDDGHIRAMFLPPNVTSLIQPMDQNVIRLVKLHYRTRLLTHIVAHKNEPVHNTLKNFTLRDAVWNLKLSWDKVKCETIVKSWKNILEDKESSADDDEEYIPLGSLKRFWEEDVRANQQEMVALLNEVDDQVRYQTASHTDLNGFITYFFVFF